ncbi:hypothetical protein HYPSUDRAFT_98145, partial [Hypholoma sublateritium FD-334 SS-4]
ALKRGGIIWHLATDTASFESVLVGPTAATTLFRQCATFATDDSANNIWVDDALDPTEADILSGVYYVYTGHGSQLATKSWWP